jgi:hypothetical protein
MSSSSINDLLTRLSPINLLFMCKRLPSRSRINVVRGSAVSILYFHIIVFELLITVCKHCQLSTDSGCDLFQLTSPKVFTLDLQVDIRYGYEFKARLFFCLHRFSASPDKKFGPAFLTPLLFLFVSLPAKRFPVMRPFFGNG